MNLMRLFLQVVLQFQLVETTHHRLIEGMQCWTGREFGPQLRLVSLLVQALHIVLCATAAGSKFGAQCVDASEGKPPFGTPFWVVVCSPILSWNPRNMFCRHFVRNAISTSLVEKHAGRFFNLKGLTDDSNATLVALPRADARLTWDSLEHRVVLVRYQFELIKHRDRLRSADGGRGGSRLGMRVSSEGGAYTHDTIFSPQVPVIRDSHGALLEIGTQSARFESLCC
eukprot:2738091-Amphidinium_carterae.2